MILETKHFFGGGATDAIRSGREDDGWDGAAVSFVQVNTEAECEKKEK